MKFLLATNNTNKLIELKRILTPMGIEVISKADINVEIPEVEETGDTFEENALLKAFVACKASGIPAIADDSGLCVDALGGKPGVYSARFAGEPCNDRANNEKLLKLMEGIPFEQRTAHFVCVVACVFPDGRKFTVRGTCSGHIGFEPKGSNGFGYDPLFVTESGTFAELTAKQKDKISHRSMALRRFAEEIKRYL
ncbi:MAG TPA: XTP/dITP diphosphatase [Clostridiales bacterium]|nr:XTP/dITP diphosphatase [Clostridiales bacterium]